MPRLTAADWARGAASASLSYNNYTARKEERAQREEEEAQSAADREFDLARLREKEAAARAKALGAGAVQQLGQGVERVAGKLGPIAGAGARAFIDATTPAGRKSREEMQRAERLAGYREIAKDMSPGGRARMFAQIAQEETVREAQFRVQQFGREIRRLTQGEDPVIDPQVGEDIVTRLANGEITMEEANKEVVELRLQRNLAIANAQHKARVQTRIAPMLDDQARAQMGLPPAGPELDLAAQQFIDDFDSLTTTQRAAREDDLRRLAFTVPKPTKAPPPKWGSPEWRESKRQEMIDEMLGQPKNSYDPSAGVWTLVEAEVEAERSLPTYPGMDTGPFGPLGGIPLGGIGRSDAAPSPGRASPKPGSPSAPRKNGKAPPPADMQKPDRVQAVGSVLQRLATGQGPRMTPKSIEAHLRELGVEELMPEELKAIVDALEMGERVRKDAEAAERVRRNVDASEGRR